MQNSLGIVSPLSNTEKVLFTIWKYLPLTKVFLTENQVLGYSDEHRAFAFYKGVFCWRNLDFNFKGTKSETSLQERRLCGAPVMGVRKMFIVTGIGIHEHLLTVAWVQVPPPQTPGSGRLQSGIAQKPRLCA